MCCISVSQLAVLWSIAVTGWLSCAAFLCDICLSCAALLSLLAEMCSYPITAGCSVQLFYHCWLRCAALLSLLGVVSSISVTTAFAVQKFCVTAAFAVQPAQVPGARMEHRALSGPGSRSCFGDWNVYDSHTLPWCPRASGTLAAHFSSWSFFLNFCLTWPLLNLLFSRYVAETGSHCLGNFAS